MLTGGYIKLHRKITEWEWYHDVNVTRVFVHLLLTANYEPKKWHGVTIGIGERIISLQGLADEVGLAKSTIVRVLNCLEKTGEIERNPTAKFTIITLKNYTAYNAERPLPDRCPTDSRPLPDPMEESKERKRKQESKKEGGSKAPARHPLTPEEKIAFVLEWGEDNVNRYIDKIKKWKISQGREPEVDAELLDRWIREDYARGKFKNPSECGGGSFNIDDLERSSYDRYRKGK